MIPRYTRPEMGQIWSDQNKFQRWLDVEIATAEAEAEAGMIPKSAARAIRKKGKFSVERILEIEKQVKHDVIAFTTNVAEHVGREARYLHFGLTSNDVVDTAQALQIRDASEIISKGLKRLGEALKKRAFEFKHTPMMGRTHGIHAEPITFGCKLAIWHAENQRNTERFAYAAEQMRVGKISGVVGMYGHSTPKLEEAICKRLGLTPAPISSQVIQRDRHAFYVCTLAVIAASLEKIALEVRGLQRTDVILPDSTILVDYLLDKTAKLVETMFVYPQRMIENLNMMRGLIYSGQLLLDLAAKGAAREDAYSWVQRNAMQVWETREDFKTLVERDPDIRRYLKPSEIAAVFNVERYLTHVDAMFARVFGS
ncbi:MAG: adenylosuccinate lyase [Acidobacteriia bacterium]|nr:adenylosuccinate lyase [Terriglobia bacterium]